MILQELEARIHRGQEAIAKARAQGKDVKDWEEHLGRLEALVKHLAPDPAFVTTSHAYKGDDDVTTPTTQPGHALKARTGKDYLPLAEVTRLLTEVLNSVAKIYPPGTISWLEAERPELRQEILSLDRALSDQGKALAEGRGNRGQFDQALRRYKQLWEEAIALRRNEANC